MAPGITPILLDSLAAVAVAAGVLATLIRKDLAPRLDWTGRLGLGMALFRRIGCVKCHSGPNFSGATREVVAKWLGRFAARGWAKTGRGRVVLTDPAGLASLVGGEEPVWA
ncbi:MAG: winged helix-turn-helix domain-containing protein [Alphaproteobacteria bacterium]|nr:winged helix-turn-helix domain-containing protein [Alphaproteobacteria bacterium]